MASPNVPLNSVTGIEALIAFGTQIFVQIFSLFRHQGIPPAAAPQIQAQLIATPGLTPEHQTVVANAVKAAVDAHAATSPSA